MQSLNIKTYLLYAIYIVRTSPGVITVLFLLGIINGITIFMPESSLNAFLNGVILIASIFISPVIYGFFYEKVEERQNPLSEIFRLYVPGYLLLMFCMYIPIFIGLASISVTAGGMASMAHILLTLLFFSLLYVYVIPTYFISGKIIYSIGYGIQFFLKNLMASAPLLIMALASEIMVLLTHYNFTWLKELNLPAFIIFDFLIYLIASIIDFLLFIILIYILRNQEDIEKRDILSH